LFEALSGIKPSSAPCWEAYRAHVARRNSVVHRGAPVGLQTASESIEAVVQMVRFLEQSIAGR
jgi:hypothetical protein